MQENNQHGIQQSLDLTWDDSQSNLHVENKAKELLQQKKEAQSDENPEPLLEVGRPKTEVHFDDYSKEEREGLDNLNDANETVVNLEEYEQLEVAEQLEEAEIAKQESIAQDDCETISIASPLLDLNETTSFILDETPQEAIATAPTQEEIEQSQAETVVMLNADKDRLNIHESQINAQFNLDKKPEGYPAEEVIIDNTLIEEIAEEVIAGNSDKEELLTDQASIFALKAETFIDKEDDLGEKSETEAFTVETIQFEESADEKSLGALLQKARLARNFSIKDAAELTRIKSSYIIALEKNDFSELPIKVYTLNYIRQLASEYNVSHDYLVDLYQQQCGEIGEDGNVLRAGDREAAMASRPGNKYFSITVLVLISAVVILFIVGFFNHWFGPGKLADQPKVDIDLKQLRTPITLPSPELPVPGA